MRYREKLNSVSNNTHRYCWLPSNGVGTMDQTIPYLNTSSRAGMWDVVTEGFLRKRNQGVIMNNPMFSEESHYLYSPCRWILDGSKGSTGIHCEYYENKSFLQVPNGGFALTDLTSFQQLLEAQYQTYVDLAVSRAWADVDVSEMQILASIGELPETLRWIVSLLSRCVRLTKAFKKRLETDAITRSLKYAFEERGLRKDAKKLSSWLKLLERRSMSRPRADLIGGVSQLYLEYRYAVRPLFFDMVSALKALNKQLTKQRLTARGKEVVLQDYSKTIVPPRDAYSASHYVDMVIKEQVKAELVARAGVLYTVEDGINSLLSVWGFDQPLESLWELVPFSFIIDWFFSVGDVISSWSQSSGLTPLTSWVTFSLDSVVERKTVSVVISDRSDYRWPSKTVVQGSSYWATRRKWRVPSPARPILPSFDLRLNIGKILDLGAIGRQMLGQDSVPRFIRR